MEYRKRMMRCLVAALALHLVLFVVVANNPRRMFGAGASKSEEPLVLTFKQPDRPLRLIESGAPASEPVDPRTDLISERNSKAQDMSDVEGSRPAPYVPTPAESDEMRTPEPALEPPKPAQQPVTPKPAEPPADPVSPEKPPADQTLQATNVTAEQPTVTPEEDREEERIQLAKADPNGFPAEPGQTRGRVDGGVKGMGFLSFEAMESEFAPYLRDVRNRVERRWKALIQLRYSGSSTTKAVLDCAIDPKGRLVHVTVVEPGDSASYAGLCKEAIERAGPFPPFPFEVPEVYRNKNLEIRWTFSFL